MPLAWSVYTALLLLTWGLASTDSTPPAGPAPLAGSTPLAGQDLQPYYFSLGAGQHRFYTSGRIIEADDAAKMDNTVKTEPETVITNVKVEGGINNETKTSSIKAEELEFDSIASLSASSYMVSPCNMLTRRWGNPNADLTNLFAPWRYLVRPFDVADIATEVAKRKGLFDEIEEQGRKRPRL
ncbi:hypothetical protein DFH29DRAFT_882551 [Suillus ampliporus]|nr:hypothetical protein DFH29DRAFT_882551 [Suillus ampliporus]